MSGKRHSTWIHIWRSLKWPSHTRLHDAAQAVTETETSPVPPPLPVPADPAHETMDHPEVAAKAFVKVPLIPPLLPVYAEPTCEADEPAETAVSVQSSRPTTDFALPGRLAVVAKLNVPSSRATALTVCHLERRYPSLQEPSRPTWAARRALSP